MKLKLRFDKAALQDFFIQNVEKMVFGVAAIVFLLLVYSVVTVERYPKTPDDLRKAVQDGENTIKNLPATKAEEVADYEAQAKKNRIPTADKPYLTPMPWDPPIFPKRPLRGTPALFVVKNLRGTVGAGAVNMVIEPPKQNGDEDAAKPDEPAAPPAALTMGIRGQRWIVLTGLVPYDDEIKAFSKLITSGPPNSYDPQHDLPYYCGYYIQRAEMDSPSDAEPDWKNIKPIMSSKLLLAAKKAWGQSSAAEVVPMQYIFQLNPESLVFPLPPTATPWNGNESVAHPPEITLQPPAAAPVAAPAPIAGNGNPAAPAGDSGWGRPPGDVGPLAPVAPAAAAESRLPYVLFRFFDLNVTPGKHYKYRVQLVLFNPNYKLPIAWLSDPKSADKDILTTDWSDPSPTISVAGDTRALAVSVKKAGRDAAERSAQVMVVRWLSKRGVDAFKEFTAVRGQVLNFLGEKFRVGALNVAPGAAPAGPMMPRGPAPMMPRGPAPMMPRGPVAGVGPRFGPGVGGPSPFMPPAAPMAPMAPQAGAGAPATQVLVNYITNTIALDFRGGERLRGRKSGNLTAPGMVLLMDFNGNLVLLNELDDEAECRRLNSTKVPDTPTGAGTGRPEPNRMGAGGLGGNVFQGDKEKKGKKPHERPPARGAH
jgi:hypothetical protein